MPSVLLKMEMSNTKCRIRLYPGFDSDATGCKEAKCHIELFKMMYIKPLEALTRSSSDLKVVVLAHSIYISILLKRRMILLFVNQINSSYINQISWNSLLRHSILWDGCLNPCLTTCHTIFSCTCDVLELGYNIPAVGQ